MGSSYPIHILHVVRRAEGGILAHVSALISGLDDRFALSLAAPKDVFDSISDPSRVKSFIPVDIGDRIGPDTILQGGRLAGSVRKSRADIVHAHGYKAAVPASIAARLAGRPLVVTGHNLFPTGASGAARASIRLVSRLATRFIAVSESLAGSLSAVGVDAGKITVVPCGIDLDTACSGSRAAGRSAIAAGGDEIILCVARLTAVKGVDVLIRAAGYLSERRPSARLVIAGDGPDRHELEDMANKFAPGRVRFLGYRNDIPDLIAAADVVAVPSRAEGYGLIAVQAMAAARPVVASDVGGLADNVTNDTTGVLVPPGDPESLAAGIVRVLESSDFAADLGRAAAEHAAREFGIDLMISRTEEVYQCVVS